MQTGAEVRPRDLEQSVDAWAIDGRVVDWQSVDWRAEAACVPYAGEVDFFPTRGESAGAAKAVCATCPVRRECLEYALQWEHLCGVWGGLSERERRQLRRRRSRARRTS
jgi:WhiB family redox-sensing transcriptional regulator